MATITTDKTYRILSADTQAIIVDVQAKLLPLIEDHGGVLRKISLVIKGLKALGIPMLVNEQYPQGLGHTVPELQALLGDSPVMAKVTFSGCDNAEIWRHLATQNRQTILLCGIEAHVCVMQTALDLLDSGMQPVIIADATGSRHPYDRKLALRRMRRAGAVITTVEAILFELCRSSQAPAFKAISALIKDADAACP